MTPSERAAARKACAEFTPPNEMGDSDYIVFAIRARTALPAALDEIDRLEAILARLRDVDVMQAEREVDNARH